MKRWIARLHARWPTAKSDTARLRRWLRNHAPFYVGSSTLHLAVVGATILWTINKAASPPQPAESARPPLDTEIEAQIEPDFILLEFGGPRSLAAKELPAESADTSKVADGQRALAAALDWLARHQNDDGSWSFAGFRHRCQGDRCTAAGHVESAAAATALGLLPFVTSGHSHLVPGSHQQTVARALDWLLAHQSENGDLSARSDEGMVAHALASLALCEAYRLTHDERLGLAAERASNFSEAAQNPTTGGWPYYPGDGCDAFYIGWLSLAPGSAELTDLATSTTAFPNDLENSPASEGTFAGHPFGEHLRIFARPELLAAQARTGCEAGSWSPEQTDEISCWQGGRLLATSLVALSLSLSSGNTSGLVGAMPIVRKPGSSSPIASPVWRK
jgi:hypothetical protein